MKPKPSKPVKPTCEDGNKHCAYWAGEDECKKNPEWSVNMPALLLSTYAKDSTALNKYCTVPKCSVFLSENLDNFTFLVQDVGELPCFLQPVQEQV